MTARFTLTELQILSALADGEKVAAIGRQLFVGQPAASRAIKELERKCQVRITDHSGNRVRLTAAGAEVARIAKELMAHYSEFEHTMSKIEAGQAGPVRVAATHTAGEYVLPAIVGTFMQEVPFASVELTVIGGGEIWAEFGDGQFDLAVGPYASPRPIASSRWSVTRLYDDNLTFFVARDHPLAEKRSLRWAELRDETIVGPFQEPYWSRLWDRFTHERFHSGRRVEMRSLEAVKRFVEAGSAVGILIGASVKRDFEDGRLVPLYIEDMTVPMRFYMATKPSPSLPIVERFCSYLQREIAELSPAIPTILLRRRG
jgi:DNA-binding transcriptional LysR family regulator